MSRIQPIPVHVSEALGCALLESAGTLSYSAAWLLVRAWTKEPIADGGARILTPGNPRALESLLDSVAVVQRVCPELHTEAVALEDALISSDPKPLDD